jgi:hypothetical protein
MQWNVALDIGASGVRMAVRGRGLVFQESAAVAMRAGEAKPLFIGNAALPFYGRATGQIRSAFPMDAGQVSDEAALRAWLTYLLREVSSLGLAHRPRVLIARSPEAGSYTAKALVALCMESGAAGCSLIRSDLMAAIGAGCDPMRPEATLVGELGAGSMAVTLFSLGRAVETRSPALGCAKADEAHQSAFAASTLWRRPETAEELKLSLLSRWVGTNGRGGAVCDLNLSLRAPAASRRRSCNAAVKPVWGILFAGPRVCAARRRTGRGTWWTAPSRFTGGGASLFGQDKLIAERTVLCIAARDRRAAWPAACGGGGEPENFSLPPRRARTRLNAGLPGA